MTFSRIICRPTSTKKEQATPMPHAKPTLATTHMGRGVWQLGPAQIPPTLYKASVDGDFYTDTMFNPVWGEPWWLPRPTLRHGLAHPSGVPSNTVRDFSQRPPQLTLNVGSAESSLSRSPSSTPDLLSPARTGCSVTAVLGSAGLHKTYAFENDYNRSEASSDFVRTLLQRSKLLRCQAWMRDGHFRIADEEHDEQVEEEPAVIVGPELCPRRIPLLGGAPVRNQARATTTPSRLSQRVRVPPPINTAAIREAEDNELFYSGLVHEVEVGDVDGRALPCCDSGFEADDEDDDDDDELRSLLSEWSATETLSEKTVVMAENLTQKMEDAMVCATTPPRKTYAAVVGCSSPDPKVKTSDTRATPLKAHHTQRVLGCKEACLLSVYEWQPFVEPLDL